MDEILNYSMNEMAKASFDCSCGRHHTLDIDKLVMGQGVIKELPEMVKGLGAKKVYMLSDNNTYKAAGETAETLLKDAGFQVKSVVLDSGEDILIPDEQAVGTMFLNLEPETDVLIAAGSGTLNDMVKYMSARKIGRAHV